MKKLFALLLFVSLNTIAQIGEVTKNIGLVKIKSKLNLIYEARNQKADTIYISIKRWNYDLINKIYTAEVADYIKKDSINYLCINHKYKNYSKVEVDALFSVLGNSILPSEQYSDEMDFVLKMALLLDTQTNLLIGDKTVYGGNPVDWELIN